MKLTAQQGYALLERHGCYITEICDACGKGIGPVRFTRKDDLEVWCSQECRDGKEARPPGTCKASLSVRIVVQAIDSTSVKTIVHSRAF